MRSGVKVYPLNGSPDGEALMVAPGGTIVRVKGLHATPVATAPETCWTTFIGAPTHNLGELPEKCCTCAAHRKQVPR